jgi:hypothetical protein
MKGFLEVAEFIKPIQNLLRISVSMQVYGDAHPIFV